MTHAFHLLIKRMMGAVLSVCLGLCLIISPFGQIAEAKYSMSGDYLNDTLTVARSLQETVSIPDDAEGRIEADKEAVVLITDYISRYRNRSQVNSTVSFTTMQTALNALAGHVKTFPKRPIPQTLKDRLAKELGEAEKMVTRES